MDKIKEEQRTYRKLYPITARQAQVVHFIRDFLIENGYPPTLDEIADNLGVKTKKSAFDHLMVLHKKGYLTYTPHKKRAIKLHCYKMILEKEEGFDENNSTGS